MLWLVCIFGAKAVALRYFLLILHKTIITPIYEEVTFSPDSCRAYHYERNHDYDEYHFTVDEIEHDPYVLISAITALKGGAWKIEEVGGKAEVK